jgi:hypothetical protein
VGGKEYRRITEGVKLITVKHINSWDNMETL